MKFGMETIDGAINTDLENKMDQFNTSMGFHFQLTVTLGSFILLISEAMPADDK